MKRKALMKTSWIISCGQKRIMYQKYAYTKCNNAKEHYYSVKQRRTHTTTWASIKESVLKGFIRRLYTHNIWAGLPPDVQEQNTTVKKRKSKKVRNTGEQTHFTAVTSLNNIEGGWISGLCAHLVQYVLLLPKTRFGKLLVAGISKVVFMKGVSTYAK